MENILKQTSISEAQTILHGYFDKKEKEQDFTEYSLFHIFLQREEKLCDILEILNTLPKCTISIVEASHISQHIYSLPLYAGFWTKEGGINFTK